MPFLTASVPGMPTGRALPVGTFKLLRSLFLPSVLSALSGTTVVQTVHVLLGVVASLLVAVSLSLIAGICFQFSQQGFQVFNFQELFFLFSDFLENM